MHLYFVAESPDPEEENQVPDLLAQLGGTDESDSSTYKILPIILFKFSKYSDSTFPLFSCH